MSDIRIYQGDFRDSISLWPHYKMLFADPPDNNGLGYDGFIDRMTRTQYRNLMYDTLAAIRKCDVLWVSFNPNHLDLVGSLLYEKQFVPPELEFHHRFIMQYVSFGYNMPTDFSRCFRPLLRLMRKDAVTYPDAVRIESDRQKQGDKRANPLGKIPPDVWAIHRVTGNSRQRRKWHKTQLNEALYERCLDFSCVPGDLVADMYAGTGTMGRAAQGRKLKVDLFDISETYCEKMAEEFGVCAQKWEV